MKTKRLRGGQTNTTTIPQRNTVSLTNPGSLTNGGSLFEGIFKYVLVPIIVIGIVKDFITGNAGSGGALLFFFLFFMFILYLTTLGVDYINNPNGYSIIKVILGVLMLFNTGAIFVSVIGLIVILLIVLSGLFS